MKLSGALPDGTISHGMAHTFDPRLNQQYRRIVDAHPGCRADRRDAKLRRAVKIDMAKFMTQVLSFETLAHRLEVSPRQARRLAVKFNCDVMKFYGHGSRLRVPDATLNAMQAEATGRRWQTKRTKRYTEKATKG